MRRSVLTIALLVAASGCSGTPDPIVIGAVYPTAGGQGTGGVEELMGVQLAAELANARGGVHGRPIRIEVSPADSSDAGPDAVERLSRSGVQIVLGSYGSTISRTAAAAASRRGMVFWETGAVGMLDPQAIDSGLVFRFPPTGDSLGRAAVAFVRDRLVPQLPAPAIRYSVTYVDDVYGRSVGLGAIDGIRASGLELAGVFPYVVAEVDYDRLARQIARARTEVLIVAAYLQDGIDLRRALVRGNVPLVAAIGSSSSYCMPEFGATLGSQAVGLFASDKPDADVLDPSSLSPGAAEVLEWAREEYRERFDTPMSGAALSGFSAAWALFRHVLPNADGLSPRAVARAANEVRVDSGSLPNGSGLEFGPTDGRSPGVNLRAVSVIWEWVRPGVREVVWPPAYATSPIVPIQIA